MTNSIGGIFQFLRKDSLTNYNRAGTCQDPESPLRSSTLWSLAADLRNSELGSLPVQTLHGPYIPGSLTMRSWILR